MAIVTHFDPKPIPDRRWDWEAHSDGYDLGMPVGLGATEAEAIEDLVENCDHDWTEPHPSGQTCLSCGHEREIDSASSGDE